MAIKIKDADGNEHEIMTKDEQSDMVTGAVKSATKKLAADLTTSITEKVSQSVGETLTAFETKRQEAAEAAEAERAAAAAANGGAGNKGADTVKVEDSPAFKTLQKQLAASVKAQEASEAKAKAEAMKARDTSLRQRVGEALDKLNFDPKARALAMSHLIDGAKLAHFDGETDAIVFKDTDGSDVELEAGLKSFAQTDLGKVLMPPSGASGTGDRSRFVPPTQKPNGKVDSGELGRMVLNTMAGLPQTGG